MADLLPSSPDPSAGDGGEPRVIGVDSEDADDLLSALQSETARDLLAALYDEPATPSQLAEAADTSVQNVRYHLQKLTDADLVEVADTIYSEKGREMKVYAPTAKPLVVFAGGEDETPGIEAALSRLLGGVGVLAASSLLVQRIAEGGSLVPDVSFGMSAGGGADSTEGTTGTNATWTGSDLDATTRADDATEEVAETTPEAATTAADGTRTVSDGATTEATRTESGATETAAEATTTATETGGLTEETVRRTTEEAARTTTVATDPTPTPEATTTAVEAAREAASGLPPGLLFFAGGLVVLLALSAAWYLRAR